MALALKYALFAALAMGVNLGVQMLWDRLYDGPYELWLAMAVGTLAGLVVKYLLDKRYIFAFRAASLAQDAGRFVLYSLMGLATTAIFWGFEAGFDLAFGTRPMRYLGAALGLVIGYWTKYHLDKRWVFGSA